MRDYLRGMDVDTFEKVLKECIDKVDGVSSKDWQDIVEEYKLDIHRDVLRKGTSAPISAYTVYKHMEEKMLNKCEDSDLLKQIEELKSERNKIRTLNIERNKIDRVKDRRELYYENIGVLIKEIEQPKLQPIHTEKGEELHILDFADVHYNAKFTSITNSYSRDIAKERFNKLLGETIEYVNQNKVNTLYIVNGGDSLQGMLRASDLKLNDLGVIDSLVEFQKVMASFLNELSAHCNVRYYHVNSANHTELRLLNAQAGQMAVEDMEKIIVNYLHDVLKSNDRIHINQEFEQDTIQFNALGYEFICLHGHQLKNIKTSIRDLSDKYDKAFDFCLLGHYHSGVEMVVGERKGYAKEVLVSPSFVGTCPYADKLMVGGKGMAKIHKFASGKGRIGTVNIVLN